MIAEKGGVVMRKSMSIGKRAGRAMAAAGLAGVVLAGLPARRAAADWQFTMVDNPADNVTSLSAVSGTTFVGNSGYLNGFVYNGSIFTPVNDPLGDITTVNGVSGNTVVGTYEPGGTSAGGVLTHGFIYDGIAFTTLNDPLMATNGNGAGGTQAFGISGANVVGAYTTDEEIHGFLYNGSGYTTLDDPLAGMGGNGMGTYARAISGRNIVGYYFDSNIIAHGFIYNGSTYTTLDDPLALQRYVTLRTDRSRDCLAA
jgi:hypothetical protein